MRSGLFFSTKLILEEETHTVIVVMSTSVYLQELFLLEVCCVFIDSIEEGNLINHCIAFDETYHAGQHDVNIGKGPGARCSEEGASDHA